MEERRESYKNNFKSCFPHETPETSTVSGVFCVRSNAVPHPEMNMNLRMLLWAAQAGFPQKALAAKQRGGSG